MPAPLRLEVTDYVDDCRWRFRLDDGRGTFLADHEVDLTGAPREVAAWRDLPGYLYRYRPARSEEELLGELGDWLGRAVLGNVGAALGQRLTPPATVVELRVPEKAQDLFFRPFELAHVGGRPLAEAGVRLVYRFAAAGAEPARPAKEAGTRLRVLAAFSLPSAGSPLDLRKERFELARQIERLAETRGAAVELKVLQYGATRDVLREALREGEGWDLIHFSGHGLEGELVLEDDRGEADRIDAEALAELLRPARQRLHLLTLSVCLSGAASVAAARREVGLDEPPARESAVPAGEVQEGATRLPSLAQRLSEELDCAVVAMRYSVGDEFARESLLALYDRLLDKGQPLPAALQLALEDTLFSPASPRRLQQAPALSLATPILFGPRAAALRLVPPAAAVAWELPVRGLLGFPDEPERFVGRLLPMLAASRALAPESGKSGVLFHGMAGAGKTSCALELAYRHESGRFLGQAWWKAPEEGVAETADEASVAGSLTRFALALERQLGAGLGLVGGLDNPAEFPRTLLRLKALLRSRSLLLVIDNLEGLLTASDGWRDPRWGELIETLLDHSGLSRLVLTSRRVPADLVGHERLATLPVHALSFPESVLLARDLPGLAPLFATPEGRRRLRRILAAAQGHPKLLDLAAKQEAADPAGLDRQLRQEEGLGEDPRFFAEGETSQGPAEMVRTLESWTLGILRRLPATARLLFGFLSRLEEEDRQGAIVPAVWKNFLSRLAPTRPEAAAALAEEGLGLPAALAALAVAGLVEVRGEGKAQSYRLHPALAEAGRQEAGEEGNAAADRELGDWWVAVARHGLETEMQGGGRLVVKAGKRGAPYWLRAGRWEEASTFLEQLTLRDRSPATLAEILPLLRRIVEATRGAERELIDQGVMAIALQLAGRWGEADALLRDLVERCEERGQLRQASAIAGNLLSLLRVSGRYEETLPLAERKAALTRRAGLGPWSQMLDEAQRLQILAALGQHEEVLAEVERLRERMAALPESSEAEEAANPWNVREVVLDTGGQSAQELKRWELALELNEAQCQAKKARGADAHELAYTRFNDYGPLLRLGRLETARQVLEKVRQIFEEAEDLPVLGPVYSALADLEYQEGNRPAAVRFEGIALRYKYQVGDPQACAGSHHNLANCLEGNGASAEAVLAQRWAAGAIWIWIRSGLLQLTFRALAARPLPPAPPSFEAVADGVETLEGVRFRELFARLPQTFPDGDAALAEVWRLAGERRAQGGE